MSTSEERQILIATAKELIETLQQITRPVNDIACKLDGEIQALLPKVLAEQKEDGYKPTEAKRACSICRQPGHRSTTCPQRTA